MSYQMIAQWELLHKDHNFATHIPIFFKKLLKYLFILLFHHLGCAYVKGNSLDINFKHVM